MKKILLSLFVFGLMFSFAFLVSADAYTFIRNLKIGSRGDDVKVLQQILKDKGFLNGTADGKFGNMTKNAVKKYQTANGLSSDGKVGPNTIKKLNEEKKLPESQNVTVLSPNGGEKIMLGQSYPVTWSSSGFSASDKVTIYLKNDSLNCPTGMVGCWTEFGIVSQPIQNTGSYVWNTNLKMFGDAGPNSVAVTIGNNYKIHVEITPTNNTAATSDYSDNEFSIVQSNCPQYVPSAPGWCSNGTVVPPVQDINGCYGHPTCVSSVLQTIYLTYHNGQISECTYQGAQYYTAELNAYDGGVATYDMNGNIVGTFGGISGQSAGIQPTSCNRVYVVSPNIWGYPAVNTYNLH